MSQSVQPYTEPEATPVGHSGIRVEIRERKASAISGWFGVLVLAACIAAAVLLARSSVKALITLPIVVGCVILGSLVIVQPGETKVVRFFGKYVGTVRRTGLAWILPLADRKTVSTRVRNFETSHLKVNDADGNPVEIAAIVVWLVADTSRALYAVDDYLNFVRVQAESALRHVASTHPYDDAGTGGVSLRGSTDLVARELAEEMSVRVAIAGVEVAEVRVLSLIHISRDRGHHVHFGAHPIVFLERRAKSRRRHGRHLGGQHPAQKLHQHKTGGVIHAMRDSGPQRRQRHGSENVFEQRGESRNTAGAYSPVSYTHLR